MENMLKIEEISGEKAQKYGDRMLEVIKTFCSHKNWTTNWMPQDVPVTLKVYNNNMFISVVTDMGLAKMFLLINHGYCILVSLNHQVVVGSLFSISITWLIRQHWS